jgi:NAD(P)-dependent dehydrogenase (short-subunit alcohol dehydrogenase family)
MQSSSKETALVTGANKGIGLEIARQLGKAGFVVFLGARNVAAGQAAAARLLADNLDVHSVELDLNRKETIEAAASTIKAFGQRLDVLINSAAIVDPADGPPGTVDFSVVQRVMETNCFGTLAVTQAMLPLLLEAPAPRIVNLSSGLGSLKMNGDPTWNFAGARFLGYNTSKAAVNMLTIQLAYEFRDTPMKVNSANPGYTATDMNANQGHQTLEEGAAERVRLALLPSDGPTGGFFETAGPHPW